MGRHKYITPVIKNRIISVLEELKRSLDIPRTADFSLMSGNAGILMFRHLYNDHLGMANVSDEMNQAIQELAEQAITTTNPSFCTGKAGINWFFTYLFNKGILKKDDLDFVCDDDEQLEVNVEAMLKNGNYDFLHGALGIAHYLLYSDTTNLKFFSRLLEQLTDLINLSNDKKMIPFYDSEKQVLMPNVVNLGLAHGVPSVLKFCLECYNQNICPIPAKNLGLTIIDFMRNNTNAEKTESYYTCFIKEGENTDGFSRLGWCYGDLSIAYILYQAAVAFGEKNLKLFAMDILTKTTTRRTREESNVHDGGICHGSAGVAHIYHRLWHYTNQPIFREACDFWICRTLDNLECTNWVEGYKKYNILFNSHENSNSFLEGSAGIGLVLLSYLNGDFSWDYPLMLN